MNESKQVSSRKERNLENLETVPLDELQERPGSHSLNLQGYDTVSLSNVPLPAFGQKSEAVREVNFDFLEAEQEGAVPEERFSGEAPSVYRRFSGWLIRWIFRVPTPLRYFTHLTLFLVILGVLSAAVIFLVDLSVHVLEVFRIWISSDNFGGYFVGFIFYFLTALILCLLSTFACQALGKEAEGSGIPQMKSILSGFYDRSKNALKLRVLGAKSLGLICAIGGGLPVGWEGPNVHIACIISHQLSRLPFFRFIRRDKSLRLQMIGAACAVGLASSFGAPVGGVLYSLETTASFYIVRTFWKATAATVSGALIYKLLYDTPLVEAFQKTSFDVGVVDPTELVLFALLGILMGCAGSLFVFCVHQVYRIRMKKLPLTNRYILVGIVASVAAILQYPVELFRLDPRMAINELFSPETLRVLNPLQVFLLLVVKFPLVVVSVGLPIPAGVFVPSFLLGSCFGRLYGELLKLIFGDIIVPGGYAVVAAASFTTGVTRALSCAVIIFEVTGQLRHLVPTLVAVLFAFVTGNIFNRSLYDTLIIMKNIPYMPYMRKDRTPDMKVSQVMIRECISVQEYSNAGMLQEILQAYPEFSCFPVVNKDGYLLGAVKRRTLLTLVATQSQQSSMISKVDVDYGDNEEFPASSGNMAYDEEEEEEEDSVHSIENSSTVSSNRNHSQWKTKNTNGGHNYLPESSLSHMEVPKDVSPLLVTEDTQLGRVHFLFVMLMPKCAYVVNGGKLTGVVTRLDIVECGQSSSTS
ncbi:chloride channel/carrier, CIC family [Galdieria sulphuraria]|uniref:Chloride channel protein n=1 Tax=Galdieria sulphuraria TaxID=130081 RepID=M2X3L1_GALSU|nr:chloride channel/carrier, CIC family [Galdieria sulphuraria]EME31005.1 chloride channel/carrier, CIC family [Galdieria sulphuraria]|eukprot:XP_005707525.1 chloride channel/carrier, CIC family [Galdieria sulphuraria]